MSGWGAIYNNTSYALASHSRELARLQEQAASGMRVNRPSDDPSNAYRIFRLRAQTQSLSSYLNNISDVTRNLEMSHSVLTEVNGNLTRTRQLLTQVISGTYGETAQQTIAEEVNSLLEQVMTLANSKSLGRYIFGGTNVGTAPFAAQRTSGKITSVEYAGNFRDLPVPVAPGIEYPGLMVGGELFWANDRQAPVFFGDTGAAAGSQTSTARGDLLLTVEHEATVIAGGSGVTTGTSTADDTIVGEHTLTLTSGAVDEVSLDGGPPVEFDGTETNLAVANADGATVHLDMTGWAGFTGDVDVTGEAKLSLDEGGTPTAVASFVDNVAVADPATGRVLYVDATNLKQEGVDPVHVDGTEDVFSTLIHVRDTLENKDGLPEGLHKKVLKEALNSLEDVSKVVNNRLTALGGRLEATDILKNSLESIELRAEQQADALQDADVVQVAADLARTQTLYEMTLSVSSKLLTVSLLDYL
jgi:flagellar hook-associated protein 3